ncbi:MAG: hypothetical protein V1875_08845 [Candidatus Altiarchaeota archaeon]
MSALKRNRCLVAVDVGSRSPGPFDVMLPELAGDLRRLHSVRPDKAKGCRDEWLAFREYLLAVKRGESPEGAPLKMNAALVNELLDVLPHELQVDHGRRMAEIGELAREIGSAREGYHQSGDPVIYTHSENKIEKGTKKRFHPDIAPSSSDKYVRIGADYRKAVDAVKRRVAPGGEVTLAGGYFTSCLPQIAVLLALEGYAIVLPERLTDAKLVRDSGDRGKVGDMLDKFITTLHATASEAQDPDNQKSLEVREEKSGKYYVWRIKRDETAA